MVNETPVNEKRYIRSLSSCEQLFHCSHPHPHPHPPETLLSLCSVEKCAMGQFITHSTTGDVDTIVGGYAFTNVSTALYTVHPTIVIVRTINATARDLNQLYRIKLIVVNSFYSRSLSFVQL